MCGPQWGNRGANPQSWPSRYVLAGTSDVSPAAVSPMPHVDSDRHANSGVRQESRGYFGMSITHRITSGSAAVVSRSGFAVAVVAVGPAAMRVRNSISPDCRRPPSVRAFIEVSRGLFLI